MPVQHSKTFTLLILLVAGVPGLTGNRGAVSQLVGAGSSVACGLYVAPSGSDLDTGSLDAPWKTLQHAFDQLRPGQVLCLRGGIYAATAEGERSQILDNSGADGSPILITNYPGEAATIHGSTRVNGSYVEFLGTPSAAPGLVFEGPMGRAVGLVDVMNTHDVTFDRVEIRKADYHAGFYQHGGYNIRLIDSYVHDNGRPGHINTDQGIYWDSTTGGGNLIANCLVEHNVSAGIQLYPGPSEVTVEENTIVDNGNYGMVVYGTRNAVVNNIFSNNGDVANNPQLKIASGGGHIIDSNILWSVNPAQQGYSDKAGQVVTNTIIADPLFLDPLSHDYRLQPGSPSISAGNISYAQPLDRVGVKRNSPPDLGAYEHIP